MGLTEYNQSEWPLFIKSLKHSIVETKPYSKDTLIFFFMGNHRKVNSVIFITQYLYSANSIWCIALTLYLKSQSRHGKIGAIFKIRGSDIHRNKSNIPGTECVLVSRSPAGGNGVPDYAGYSSAPVGVSSSQRVSLLTLKMLLGSYLTLPVFPLASASCLYASLLLLFVILISVSAPWYLLIVLVPIPDHSHLLPFSYFVLPCFFSCYLYFKLCKYLQ